MYAIRSYYVVGSLEQRYRGAIVFTQQRLHTVLDQRLFEQVRLVGIETDHRLKQRPHQLALGTGQQRGHAGRQQQTQETRHQGRTQTYSGIV